MTEIGEGIAVVIQRMEQDKCVFCGKADHKELNKEPINPTGWTRAEISGVGGNFVAKKKSIYPANTSPPTAYRSEGHHCLAFSSFIVDARNAPKDRFAALNHYLKQEGYNPNNPNNTIDLPGRKVKGDTDAHANFKEFELAVLAGKPLQLHIGGHKQEFMSASNMLILAVVTGLQDSNSCKKPPADFKKKLKQKIIDAEDRAFKFTASTTSPWVAHPGPLMLAEAYVKKKHDIKSIKYPQL